MTFQEQKKKLVMDFEFEYLKKLIEFHQGYVTGAAMEAGMDRGNFHRLLRKNNINPDHFRPKTHEEPISQATEH